MKAILWSAIRIVGQMGNPVVAADVCALPSGGAITLVEREVEGHAVCEPLHTKLG
jgi:hypothetical protein